MDIKKLTQSYLEHYRSKLDADAWAWEEVNNIVHTSADDGWLVVMELIKEASTDEELSYIAAGPLEDLLIYNGNAVIKRVEDSSTTNSKVHKTLGFVMKNAISDEIWEHIQSLI